jgi:hypothetical protein
MADAFGTGSSGGDATPGVRRETEAQREQRLEAVRRRIETYESCAAAVASATSSLQELSANLDKMQVAARQLNTFTGGWLAVWKRPTA